LSGYLEPTNEPYAIAKIAGIKLCESYHDQYGSNFISAMPTNLYGFNDNYHPTNSHVLPALLRRFHEAKEKDEDKVTVWGSGSPLREFMFSSDLAAACLYLMLNYNDRQFINIGTEEEISIADLAVLISEIVDYKGLIDFDRSKPDGTPRKLMDIEKLKSTGFLSKTPLREGISLAYHDYLTNSKYSPAL